jgi:TonB family protein
MKKFLCIMTLCCFCTLLQAQTKDSVTNKFNKIGYTRFDVFAKFPNGDIYDYIAQNINYPDGITTNISGRFVCSITINKDGEVSDVQILQNLSPAIDKEFVRVLKSSPAWRPATLNGEKISVHVGLMINVATNSVQKSITASKYTYPVITRAASDTLVFASVQVPPVYPGGKAEFDKYLDQNIIYPAAALKNKIGGRVFMSFIVEKDGSLSRIKALRSASDDISNECIRVLKNCKFTPGSQNGRLVRVEWAIEMKFDPNHPTSHS